MPLSRTDCGLFGALSVTAIAALLVPVAEGVKVTLIAQLVLGASRIGQVLDSAKSVPFVPLTLIELIVRLLLPVFVRVEPICALVKPTV